MKYCIIFLIITLEFTAVKAQDFDTIPPYQKDSLHIPSFTILKTDSSYVNDQKIPKDKPLVIVYFSPTCGHCQFTADEFSKKMNEMKSFFFVWLSYSPLDEIKDFEIAYRLNQYKNVVVGRDANYYIPSFYRVKSTPFMAVYSKEGHLLQTYEKGTDPDTIINLLKDQ